MPAAIAIKQPTEGLLAQAFEHSEVPDFEPATPGRTSLALHHGAAAFRALDSAESALPASRGSDFLNGVVGLAANAAVGAGELTAFTG